METPGRPEGVYSLRAYDHELMGKIQALVWMDQFSITGRNFYDSRGHDLTRTL